MPPSLRSSGIRFAALTPAARPARRSHRTARSRRRIGSARKATPRTLAPAELQARTTIKSKNHKERPSPKRSHRRTRVKAKRWRVRCGGALTRVRSVQLFRQAGPEAKATATAKAKGRAPRGPTFPHHSHKGTVRERFTRERAHNRIMLTCECPPRTPNPHQQRRSQFARCPLSNGHHQIPNKHAPLSQLT